MKERSRKKENRQDEYSEAIIVLGSGLFLANTKSGFKLSWDERMRLTAAAEYYNNAIQEDGDPLLILCGGEVYKNYPALASVAQEEAIRQFSPGILCRSFPSKCVREALFSEINQHPDPFERAGAGVEEDEVGLHGASGKAFGGGSAGVLWGGWG